ncbi:MAG: glycosyltransferase [Muribaculaceae bacterium]|nr:glycosyltransferase [Muribaculaceae bacterium]
MEGYLKQCLDSLICESLPEMEIVVVNDGSKDKTLSIAKEYEDKYPKSIIVIDKKNGNYGSCINTALKVVTGKYIKVLDADDSFENENIDDFIDCLKQTDADLVISDYVIVNEQGTITRECKFSNIAHKNIPLKDSYEIVTSPDFAMHAVTYHRNVFKDLNYVQSEGISYTDLEWMFLPMTKVNDVTIFNKVIYRYLVGRAGQTVDVKVSAKAVDQTMTVLEKLLHIYRDNHNKISDLHATYLQHRLRFKTPSVYRICLIKSSGSTMYDRLKFFDKCLEECYPELYDLMGREDIKGFPFKYVKYWRKRYGKKRGLYKLTIIQFLFNIIR